MGGGGWSACLGTKDFSRPGGTQWQAAVGCRAAGAPFAFPAGPWLPAPVQLSSDFSCFLTALLSGGSLSHADLVSSVVLRPVLLWCDSRRPKSVPHRLLPDSLGGLQSGLLFTISLPWIRPPANPRLQVRGISPSFNNNTNRCSPGHSQSSSALWDLPEPSPDHLVRPKPNHLLLLKTCFQSWLNVLQTPKPTF